MNWIHLIFLAVCWVCCEAEPQYFKWSNASTWNQARQHCQVCYKEMVNLNPQNVVHLVQNLTTDYWIGLRKNLNGSKPWSRWSNGEPVSFQNWYPGRPVLSEPKVPVVNVMNMYSCPKCDCCCSSECNTTFTVHNTTNNNTFGFSMLPPTTALATIQTTIPTTMNVSEPVTDGNYTDDGVVYIEDPCVSMASSGLWLEKKCSERLSYICFEERFYGKAEVSNITLHNATLTWMAGPGNISHYLVIVRGEQNQTFNQTERTYYFTNLTPGALYTVQVFPIKCERELNPQNTSFYTKPDVVNNLTITNVTENSVSLSWDPPYGKHGHYQVRVAEKSIVTVTVYEEFLEIVNLTPGWFYTFEVKVMVNNSKKGDWVNVSNYTKPSTVSNLKAIDPKSDSLLLQWKHPVGNYSSYKICLLSNSTECSTTSGDNTSFRVDNLQPGSKVRMSVVVLVTGNALEGDPVFVTGFTAPGNVSDITMQPDANVIKATWKAPDGDYELFCVNLRLADTDLNTGVGRWFNTTEKYATFPDLESSVKYNLSIQTINGALRSAWKSMTSFTLPKPPRNVRVISSNDTSATISWESPEITSVAFVKYKIEYVAEFWSKNHTVMHTSNLTHNNFTLNCLHPGTKYTFFIYTLAGNHSSNSVFATTLTDPQKSFLYLDMECSAATVSNCTDGYLTVLEELRKHLWNKFHATVFWKLDKEPST